MTLHRRRRLPWRKDEDDDERPTTALRSRGEMSSPDWATDVKVMNFEDLEDGEIQDDVDERHHHNDVVVHRRVTTNRSFRTNEASPPYHPNDLPPPLQHSNNHSNLDGRPVHPYGHRPNRVTKYGKPIRKAPYGGRGGIRGRPRPFSSHLLPNDITPPLQRDELPNSPPREWPTTFVHIQPEDGPPLNFTGGRHPTWDGGRHSQSPSLPHPSMLASNAERVVRCRDNRVRSGPWSRNSKYSYPRSKTIRQRSRVGSSKKRHSSPSNDVSYEDLLAQYREIKSQLEELNRQEDGDHPDGDETLDKENVKDDLQANKLTLNEDKVSSDLKSVADLKKRRARSRSRARSLSSSKSQNSDTKIAQKENEGFEDDDEQELKRIALASMKNKPQVKNSDILVSNTSSDFELPYLKITSEGNGDSPQMYDNYEEVPMELDSNCGSTKNDSDDEDKLRNQLLQGLNEKKKTKLQSSDAKKRQTPAKTSEPRAKVASKTKGVKPSQSTRTTLASNVVAPLHEKVVINLAEDSSDSDQDDFAAANVDRLLKEARQKVDHQAQNAVSNLSTAQVKEYCRLKEEIAKRELKTKRSNVPEEPKILQSSDVLQTKQAQMKAAISEDEKQMNLLKSTLLKKRRLMSLAEQKVKRLQEQLVAAQKIVTANKASINKLTAQVKFYQKRIFEAQGRLSDTKNEACANVVSPTKKRPVASQVQIYNKKTAVKASSKPTSLSKALSPREREEEKARLQKLEQEISLKLQELRNKGLEKALQKEPLKNTANNAIKKGSSTQPENIKKCNISKPDAICEGSELVELKNQQSFSAAEEANLRETFRPDVKTSVPLTQTKWDFLYFPIFSLPSSLNLQPCDLLSIVSNVNSQSNFLLPDPLHHMKSARLLLSRDIQLTSSTYTNKLNPRWMLCPYDLLGACNDDKCTRQHANDYALDPEAVCSDLVSYCPELCGLGENASVAVSKEAVRKYSEKILQGTSHQVALDEVCTHLVSEICKKIPPGERLIKKPRCWRIEQATSTRQDDKKTDKTRSSEVTFDVCKPADEKRYFGSNTYKDKVLEEKLENDPHDVQSWLQLACSKSENTSKASLDHRLHVLSRALETNHNNEELWLEYLTLYQKHPESEDFVQLCQQAVGFVQSYNVWWKYLIATKNVSDKLDVVKQIIEFLKSCGGDVQTVSRQFLEVTFYEVQLRLQSGCYQLCVTLLENFLENDGLKFLTEDDLCLVWLAYIHLKMFRKLPELFFDENNNNPGQLRSNTPVLIMWEYCLSNDDRPVDLLNQAISATKQCSFPAVLPLYQNLIALYIVQKRFDLAEEVAQSLVDEYLLIDSWILLATVYMQKSDYDKCLQILQEAFRVLPYSVRVQCISAAVAYRYHSEIVAHNWLSACIKCLFTLNEEPVINLFQHALGVSHDIDLSKHYVDNLYTRQNEIDQMYMWISYCFFLFLEKRSQEIVESLEVALTRLTTSEALQTICLFYLSSCAANIGVSVNCGTKSQWLNLFRRQLLLLGSNTSRLGAAAKDSKCCHNFTEEMLSLLLSNFQAKHAKDAIALVHGWLPRNSAILLRHLKLLAEDDDYRLVLHHTKEAFEDNVFLVDASILTVEAALKTLSAEKAYSLFCELTSSLPYAIILWEDAIKTLRLMDNQAGAEELLRRSSTFLNADSVANLKQKFSSVS